MNMRLNIKNNKLKEYSIKFLLVLVCSFIVLNSTYSQIYATDNQGILPLNMEECTGTARLNSIVQGTIVVSGRWILRNNGTWSFYESLTTNGTSPLYGYEGYIGERYASRFDYIVLEYRISDPNIYQVYGVSVYMVCNL